MSEGEKRERLEGPSDELKMIRKQLLVEKLMNNPTKVQAGCTSEEGDSPTKSFKPTLGPSSVLSRVKEFLPQMKSANDKLSNLNDLSSVSVEAEISEDQEGSGRPFIEMNLLLSPTDDSDESDIENSVTSDSKEEDKDGLNSLEIGGAKSDCSNSGGSKSKGKDLISEL